MNKTVAVCIYFMAVLSAGLDVCGQTSKIWNNNQGDNAWNNDLNWEEFGDESNPALWKVPARHDIGSENARIYLGAPNHAVVSMPVPQLPELYVGRFGVNGVLSRLDLINDASVVADLVRVGGAYPGGISSGVVNMQGGSMLCTTMQLGDNLSGATGTINMTGGSVFAKEVFLPNTMGNFGILNLGGGIFETMDLNMTNGANINVYATGNLVLPGDQRTFVNSAISNGWIEARWGNGRVEVDYGQTHPYKTTVSAAYDNSMAWLPDPGSGRTGLGLPVSMLAWSAGDGAAEHDVYLGTDSNSVDAATTGTAGIYRGRQGTTSHAPGTLEEDREYWWRVDEVDSGGSVIAKGELWNFRTAVSPRDLHADTWVATDELGRTLPGIGATGPEQPGRTVSVFYSTWHGHKNSSHGPYNVTEVLSANPTNPQWPDPTSGIFHWWDEPEAGYFMASDPWVIRRNISMLSDAGVDVLMLDATNTQTYPTVYMRICEVLDRMKREGLGTDMRICFITHHNSADTVTELYEDLYSKGLYTNLWFQWEGKPLMLGFPDGLSTDLPTPYTTLDPGIEAFFSWREMWFDRSGYDMGYRKWGWGSVSPQNHAWDESSDLPEQMPCQAGSHPIANIGRSNSNGVQPGRDQYDLTGTEGEGIYFAEQLERAMEHDPELLMLTGWNGWLSERQVQDGSRTIVFLGETTQVGDYYFIDSYNREFSHDIEPMKGGFSDNYYYQMVDALRHYKGTAEPLEASAPKTITVDGVFSDWSGVAPEYRDTLGDTAHRHYPAIGHGTPYENSTGRNDLLDMKVARDGTYVYFHAKTRDDLTSHTDPAWMNLYIDADQDKSTGWEGYDYVVNGQVNSPSSTTLSTLGYLGKEEQGWWKLDEGSGTTAADSSGNGYTGSIVGSPAWSAGKFGQAIDFDGLDDRVNVPIDVSETSYAVSLWFKTTDGNCGIFQIDGGGFDRILYLSSGNLNARMFTFELITTSGTNYADGQWHHVMHTFGGTQGGQKLYVDGQLQASGSKASSDFTFQTSLVIGFGNDAANQYFSGLIDDVRIYDESLDTADASAIFNNTPEGGILNSDIQYAYSGNEIEIRVPRSDIGQGSGADPVALDFHWTDNCQTFNDISEFFVNGDSAPNRRFNYRYQTRAWSDNTLLSDGFESGGNDYWGDWDIVTSQAYSGTHALECSSSDTDMLTPAVSTVGKNSFRISFKYKVDDVDDSDDVYLSYHNGSGWIAIEEIGTAQEDVWLHYSDVRFNSGADAQFFHGSLQFRITGASVDTGETVWIDDFEVVCNIGSEPADAMAQYYAAWTDSFGLGDTNGTGGMMFDAEPDGIYNLAEYALGGNPTVDDAATILPVFEITDTGGGSNVIDYVYNRRLDPASFGLTYGLYASTNLLSNDWTYVDYETGSAVINLEFESVSNSVPFETDEGFIQLKVEGDF